METVYSVRNKKTNLTVLVTEGENRSSLAVTRSLGRYGCNVVVTGQHKKNIASCSKYCKSRYSVPSPLRDGVAYLRAIRDIVTEQSVDVLFPMTEPAILLLADNRSQLPEDMILACPSIEKIRKVFDKFAIFRLAQEHGVAIPRTLFVDNRQDFFEKKGNVTSFPVVVKPAMSRVQTPEGFLATSVKYAYNMLELEELYTTELALEYPSMIQEKIVGPGTGLFTLFKNGRHFALFSHKRLREKPPSGGVSVVCESVPLDDEMVVSSRKLLAAVGWDGVAMVEFKRDERDGQAKLMEINGRFWGSLQLSIASGIDFPVLFLQQLTQDRNGLELVKQYQTGLKMKWFLGTLDHLFIRLRYKKSVLNLPLDAGTKLRALKEFCGIVGKNTVFDVIDMKDFGPFWCELRRYWSK